MKARLSLVDPKRAAQGKAEDARMTKFGNNCELRTAELQLADEAGLVEGSGV